MRKELAVLSQLDLISHHGPGADVNALADARARRDRSSRVRLKTGRFGDPAATASFMDSLAKLFTLCGGFGADRGHILHISVASAASSPFTRAYP